MSIGGPPLSARLVERVRAAPYAALAVAALTVAAYLCLVNLDYAALWHDEAPAALLGRNLLQRGDISGWDGRNLVGGTNGRTLNQDLRDVLPPLTYLFNAVGMAVFGVNETGARIMPALVGLLSLVLLYLLLRQHLAEHPRLILLSLLLAAGSPQLLLYFRQSRYYAFMAFAVIAAFYLYECWWRSGRAGHLGALALVAVLAFFNHYVGGAATMLALAAWHLLFRARTTTPRQWLALAAAGAVVVALGTAYLAWVGVIGGERSGFLAYTGVVGFGEYQGKVPLILLRLAIYTRELFTADWISWPVFLWFAGMLSLIPIRRRRGVPMAAKRSRSAHRGAAGTRRPQDTAALQVPRDVPGGDLPVAAAGRVVLMGALFALFSAALSVQPVWAVANPFTDLRYYMGALPLLLAMKGLFAEWAWRKSKLAGALALAVLLFSSAGAWPFNLTNFFSGERTLGLHLLQFVREIHRPYRDSIRVVSDYLLQHAAQDDLVYVPGFADREALIFTTGHRVLFCCGLNRDSPLPRSKVEALGAPLYIEEHVPDWVVVFGKLRSEYWDQAKAHYALAAQPDVFFYPTQRPELNFHLFHAHSGAARRARAAPEGCQHAPGGGRGAQAAAALRGGGGGVPRGTGDRARARAGPCRPGGCTVPSAQRHEESLEALARAAALQPDTALAGPLQRLMGRAAQELGRSEAAAQHYERALQLDPRDAEALDRLAMVRFGQQRYETALALYRRLVEIVPGDAQTHANIGAALYYLDRIDEAIRSFEHALYLDPALPTAHRTLEQLRKIPRQPGS